MNDARLGYGYLKILFRFAFVAMVTDPRLLSSSNIWNFFSPIDLQRPFNTNSNLPQLSSTACVFISLISTPASFYSQSCFFHLATVLSARTVPGLSVVYRDPLQTLKPRQYTSVANYVLNLFFQFTPYAPCLPFKYVFIQLPITDTGIAGDLLTYWNGITIIQ